MKRVLVALLLLATPLAFAYCSTSAIPMEEALHALPLNLSDVMLMFTDWSQIKVKLGLEDVTGDSSLEDRMDFVRRSTQDFAVATAYGSAYIESHAEMWGWDSTDLEWEVNAISSELPPIHFLKLRSGFDFSRVFAHFTDRGFVQTESHGVAVFIHDFDPSQAWIRTTELSILSTAYVDEGGLMILSSSPAAIEMCLSARSGEIAALDEDPFTTSALDHLGSSDSCILLRGLGECLRFTPNPILDLIGTLPTSDRISELKASMEDRKLLVPYRAFGVGYEDIDGSRIGTIVFEYDTPELAILDMPARLLLAEEGASTYYDAPISETCFTVQACETGDRAILMTVAPVANEPIRLFRMIFNGDAIFAGCSCQ
ncbi:hypothetical protein ACFLSF_05070 [Candidatus Bipolaricaulota bacterium]